MVGSRILKNDSASGCSWQHARPRGKVGGRSTKLQGGDNLRPVLICRLQLPPVFSVVSSWPTRGLPTRARRAVDGPDTGATQLIHLQIVGTFRRLTGSPLLGLSAETVRWQPGPRSTGRSAGWSHATAEQVSEQVSTLAWCAWLV